MKLQLLGTAIVITLMGQSVFAQDQQGGSILDTTKKVSKSPISKDGFKLNFKEDGSTWVKVNLTAQIWATDNQNNPGSTVNGVATPNSFQVAARRARISISSQVTDKVFVYANIASDGISSLAAGRSLPLQLIDFTAEYKIWGKHLSLGGGLSGWSGLSRYANPGIGTMLGADFPLYQAATNNVTDNLGRSPGIFAKGVFGKLDYRLSVNIPYPTTNTAFTNTTTVATANTNPQFNAPQFALNKVQPQMQGYVKYQFFDMESNETQYSGMVGSYLGQKKVLNIGAGIRYQQNAMWQGGYAQGTNAAGTQTLTLKDTARINMLLWSVDVFYDTPINKDKGTAITVYAAYSNYGFGQNYIRNSGPLNPATGAFANNTGNFNPNLSSFNGSGTAYPMVGTGSIYYVQAGYLLPKFKNGTQFQPYGQLMYASYQALKDPVAVWDLGINYLVKGHNSKFSLDYQSRPVFNISSTDNQLHEVKSARRGMIVLQYQISF